ncbi:hypothetical protein F5J12DRAFT_416820 [Pisolithus orientalis]|uniref:uncharacterized protein n=1 Tax=Pisolithus orientalis TaxID=936130 RepID=UPI00222551A7|nr:uncharacterized protein F5J12DRAFT_416820 [Pisolithus orientalis]KAI5994257.1 hypothetical protein F5J12DRAFT_416820 [Pisolithus orientalis]
MPGPSGAAVESHSPPSSRTTPDASLGQSTASNRDLSAASGQLHVHGVRINDAIRSATEDVHKAQQCEADKMLEYMLRRASETPDDLENLDSYTLLGRCMAQVLGICNEEVKDINGFPVSKIKKALVEYTAYEQEDDLYQPFVQASNTALAYLRELDIVGMRKGESAEVQMFFQRNDPEVISHISKRKPDIVVIPFARTGASDWGDHVSTIGPGKAPTASSWKDVLGVFEFKRPKSAMSSPPAKYIVSDYRPSNPKFLKSGKDGNELEEIEPQEAPVAKRATLAGQVRDITSESAQVAPRKHLLRAEPESRASKRSRTEEPLAHVTIQTALYAAEMQSANIAVKHALNCIVIGDDIWIWYYDHQGHISVAGFNFVQDLPRFLVLLYALQRFNLEDWGRNTAFQPNLEGDHIKSHTTEVERKILTLHNWKRRARIGLGGRGTGVMDVTCDSPKLEKPTETTADAMVAKIYWAEEARNKEEGILKCVENTAKNEGHAQGHVPTLVLSKRFRYSTHTIRRALGLTNPEKGSRTLVLLVFKKLSPINELKGDQLVDAWWQCVLCHYALWNDGIHHRDVSCANLMYYKVGGKVMGVLNDYDLSSLASSPNPLDDEWTGTTPFVAIDLLEEGGQNGNVKHQYRHDMESFIWVFIWISLQYKDGISLEPGPLDSWGNVNARECVELKKNFLSAAVTGVPDNIDNLALVLTLAKFLGQRLNARNDFIIGKRLALSKAQGEKSETTEQLEGIVEEYNKKVAEKTPEMVLGELCREVAQYINKDYGR